MWKKVITIIISSVVVIVLAVFGYMAFLVDDWSRDLSQNTAETSETNSDPELHPISTTLAPPELSDVVAEVAVTIPRWELVERIQDADGATLRFVRSTPIMGYKDDITVSIVRQGNGKTTGSLLSARSASRVGKGDLGQNPRNLKELLGAVRQRLTPETTTQTPETAPAS